MSVGELRTGGGADCDGHVDRAVAADAATAVPGTIRGAVYGRDHSMAVGRGRRIGTIASIVLAVLVAVAFAIAMLSQGGDADLKPTAAAKSPGVLQSSGAEVDKQDATVRSSASSRPADR